MAISTVPGVSDDSKRSAARSETEFERRQRFFRFGEQDAKTLVGLREAASSSADVVVAKFYEHLLGNEETRSHLKSERHVQNLKRTQSRYFAELFEGSYGEEYYQNRIRVGRTHERIGLGPVWYIGAYALYICELMPVVLEQFKKQPERSVEALQALVKLVFLDMSVAIDTYIEALADREAQQVRTFIDSLNEFSGRLSGAAAGIVGGTSSQSAAAQQQATSISEVTTTLSELRQTSAQALEKAEAVIGESDRSLEASRLGSQSVEAAVQGMREIREHVESIAQKIVSLSEQTQQIGDIITSVNEIAEQSKLLALNAAIEAARAGEHGKGFAVVATEIRSLADQSKQATGRVRKILGDIQGATNSAVVATEQGSKKVELGVGLANRAGETIQQLGRSIEEAAGAARLIANVSRQQSAGVQQVADAMSSINQAMNSTVAALRQTEAASQQLTEMTSSMNQLVESFSKPKVKVADYKMA